MYQFSNIYGNALLVHHLQHAIQQKRISHAYLLLGDDGSGKKLLAHTFAQTLFCEQGGTEPCGICKSCHAYDAGAHPDLILVRPEKKSLGVEEIRTKIIDDVAIKPYRYSYKIYIIEQADTMTPAAQNALLKTLEEPPSYAVFLLLAKQQAAFLETVLSRCISLHLHPLPAQIVASYLQEKKSLSSEQAASYAAYAQGSIGQALTLLEDEAFLQMRQDVLAKLQRIQNTSLAEVLLWAKEWEIYQNDFRFLDVIALWYRDLLFAKRLHDDTLLIQQDLQAALYAHATEDAAVLAHKAIAVQQARTQLTQNANFRLTIEVLLMELKGE